MAKVGRPTDYKGEKTIRKAKQYIDSCQDIEVGINKVKVKIPTAEGLAQCLKTSRKNLYNWADKYPEFLHILEQLNQEQSKRLLENGLAGTYNPTIAKLILAKHGYKEETDITSGGKPIPILGAITQKENDEKTNS